MIRSSSAAASAASSSARMAAKALARPPTLVISNGVRIQPRPLALNRPPTALAIHHSRRHFSSSTPRGDGPARSPFQVFVDTLKEELKKSQEMQDNMRQLQGEAGKIQDSETMKRMREAYERARIITSIKENPRLQKAAAQLRKSGGTVGDAVGTALRQMEDSELIKGLSAISSRMARQLADSTAPIRNTEAYKAFSETLTEAFDDGGSALRIDTGAADAREARRLKREARLRKIGRPPPSMDPETPQQAAETVVDDAASKEEADPIQQAAAAGAAAGSAGARAAAEEDGASTSSAAEEGGKQSEASSSIAGAPKPTPQPRKKPSGYAIRVRSLSEDPNAGQSLVLRPEPAYKQAWSTFKENNPIMRKLSDLRTAYDESENPFIERLRSVTETIGGWFEENEMAQVVGVFRSLDPQFSLESFQRELREYVLPEIVDAYHGAARHLLRQWCSEATYNVLMATVDPYVSKGMIANGRLLDMRNVDIMQGRMLDNNVPVLVVSFTTSELMWFKDPKTGEVKAGRDDQADLCRYAVVLTRLEAELDNEVTGGWKVVELARRGQGAFL